MQPSDAKELTRREREIARHRAYLSDVAAREQRVKLEARQARRMTGQRGNKVSLLKDDGWRR